MSPRITPPPKVVPQSVTFVKAGLPFLLFVGGSAYVLSSAIEGKNREREVSQGSHQSKYVAHISFYHACHG